MRIYSYKILFNIWILLKYNQHREMAIMPVSAAQHDRVDPGYAFKIICGWPCRQFPALIESQIISARVWTDRNSRKQPAESGQP
jgi:hypothetical protein